MKVTELLKVDVGLLDVTVVVDPAAPTLKPLLAVLALKMPCWLYVAFNAWYTPTLGFGIVKTATPLLFSGSVSDTVGEGAVLNVTFPVGVGVPADDNTVTVTLTFPYGTGSGTLIVVVVDALRVVKVHV